MYGVVLTLIVTVAILLILVVLAQNSKGGGLSSQFGGFSTSQLMGVKKTGDLLEKLTWGFAIVLLALSVSTNFLHPERGEDVLSSPNIENRQNTAPPTDILPLEGESSLEGLLENPEMDTSKN